MLGVLVLLHALQQRGRQTQLLELEAAHRPDLKPRPVLPSFAYGGSPCTSDGNVRLQYLSGEAAVS